VDEAARRRFMDFTDGCVTELMSNYGKIDILWYDVSWPLKSPELWESARRNALVRKLQPDILINDRSQLAEDFGTPEEQVTAERAGRNWEACMTFNGSWGYMPSAIDWHSTRQVVFMLRTASAGQGNLLLNIGPRPDGSVPEQAYERLIPLGQWLAANGEAAYGPVERVDGRAEWMACGYWSIKGNNAYFWADKWPGKELIIGGMRSEVKRASLLATGEEIAFEQLPERLILKGLSDENPDRLAGVSVIKLECASAPRQQCGYGYVVI
jgi:alpha-L-fucosidase